MASMAFSDMTIELKEANLKLDKMDEDIRLSNDFLNLSIDTFKEGFGELLAFFKGNALADMERARENSEFNKDMLDALKDLKPKYTGPDKAEVPKDADFGGLGSLLAGLAVVIGSVTGVIRGQLGAMKVFAKLLTPEAMILSIRKAVTSFTVGLSMQFDLLKASVIEKLSSIGKKITGVFDGILSFFSGESKLFSGVKAVFVGIKNAFKSLFEPFTEAYKVIKDIATSGPIQKLVKYFSGITTAISEFAGAIGSVLKKVGAIFKPLGILITVWDTISGAITGFAKEGFIGGIKGAIKGFFNSFIFSLADMLKDAAAWVLGLFGFENAKKFLKSFSFESMFTKIVDAAFEPLMQIQTLLGKVVDFFYSLGSKITKFVTDFEIPSFSILGKQVGPWKPFGDNVSTNTSVPPVMSSPTTTGMALQSGEKLQTAAQEKGMLQGMPASGGGSSAGGAAGVQQNNSTTVVNNSTVVVKPIPSASRRPNNSEDIFFGDAGAWG